MEFKATIELWFDADSPNEAHEHVANMMEELQENHLDPETNDPWLKDWSPVDANWIQKA